MQPGAARRARIVAAALACAAGAPLARAATPAAGDDWLYEVQRGDHLVGIAARLLESPRDWRRLQRLNRITAPRRLQPGQQLRIPQAWLRADASDAELLHVVGQVTLRDADGSPIEARSGARLRSRQTLQTGDDSSALLRFSDGSRLRVAATTRLTLDEARRLRGNGQALQTLSLQQGEVEASVRREAPKPRFEIRSPVLRLGARGTEFRAAYDAPSGSGHAAVDSGSVLASRAETAAGRGTPLGAGYGLVAAASGLSAPQPLLPPVALPPALPAQQRLPVRLRWGALAVGIAEGSAWRAQLLSVDDDRLLAERRGSAGEADFGALADGRYRLRLRAVDAQGLPGREAELTFSVAARPEPPFLSAPADRAELVGSRATLSWAQSSAAARYRLQVSASADFADPAHDLRDLEGASATIALPPGRWHWRLASLRADGHQGPWSDVQWFELRPEPPPAAPSAPSADPAADGVLRFRFSAGRADDRYQFQLVRVAEGATADFAQPLLERSADTPELQLSGLEPGRYALRARIVDARGVAGPWGPSGGFEVQRSTSWWWLPALLAVLLLL